MKDTLIKNKIINYLETHPFFNFSRVYVSVQAGNVTLFGTVSTQKEKIFAESAIKQMWQVNKVTSRLELLTEAITVRLPPLRAILSNP